MDGSVTWPTPPHRGAPRGPDSSRLILVRHAESIWNREGRVQGQLDPPLSELGIWQSRRLAERLAGARPAGFYSSDLSRARATAQAIALGIQIEPMLVPALREIALGEWQGLTRREIAERYPKLWQAHSLTDSWDMCPGAEGYPSFMARIGAALGALWELHPQGEILVVTHGEVIRRTLGTVLGTENPAIRLHNSSLTVIEGTGGSRVVTRVNDVCHLGLEAIAAGG